MNKKHYLIAVLLMISTAHASDRSGTNVLSLKNLDTVESLYSNSIVAADAASGNISKLSSPIEFKFRVNGVGRFKASFNRQKFFKFQDKNQVLLQGETEVLSGNQGLKKVSSASLVRNGEGGYFINIMTLSNARRKNGWKGVMTVNLEVENQDDKFIVKNKSVNKSSKSSAAKFKCINNQHSHSVADLSGLPTTKAIVKFVTVLLEADAEYAEVLRTEPRLPGEIRGTLTTSSAMVMNQTDAVYQSDLGISLAVTLPTAVTNYTEPVEIFEDENGEDVFAFIEMAAAHPASSRVEDVHFLLTGKESETLAGVAREVGSVCRNPANSVALTIRIDDNEDFISTAHEIGHLLGGFHDDEFTSASKPGIMESGNRPITGEITNFSAYSKSEIGAFVQENSSCMTEGEGTGGGGGGGVEVPSTLPAGSIFDAYRDGKYLIAEIYDEESESGHAGIPVSVLYKKSSKGSFAIIKTIVTDEDGYAEYKVKKKKLGTYALEAGGVRSRSVKIKK